MNSSDWISFDHWRDVPKSHWPWKHFSPQELACRGTGQLMVHKPSMNKLEMLRKLLGRPMILNSAYRSKSHNTRVGGARNSYHLKAMAFDCRMDNHDPYEFEQAARRVGFTGFGFYKRQNFIHFDTGPARQWGKRWWDARHREATAERVLPIEQPAIESNPLKDQGVQSASLASIGMGVREFAYAGGNFLSQLHPHAQTAALVVAGLAVGTAVYLGWGKLRQMLR